jgi:hypothetical protein
MYHHRPRAKSATQLKDILTSLKVENRPIGNDQSRVTARLREPRRRHQSMSLAPAASRIETLHMLQALFRRQSVSLEAMARSTSNAVAMKVIYDSESSCDSTVLSWLLNCRRLSVSIHTISRFSASGQTTRYTPRMSDYDTG